jgi:hypothetical protein
VVPGIFTGAFLLVSIHGALGAGVTSTVVFFQLDGTVFAEPGIFSPQTVVTADAKGGIEKISGVLYAGREKCQYRPNGVFIPTFGALECHTG